MIARKDSIEDLGPVPPSGKPREAKAWFRKLFKISGMTMPAHIEKSWDDNIKRQESAERTIRWIRWGSLITIGIYVLGIIITVIALVIQGAP